MQGLHTRTCRACGLVLLSLGLALGTAAQAHNVWLEPDDQGGYLIKFGGHAGKEEAFERGKLQSVRAYDGRGRITDAKVEDAPQGIRVLPSSRAKMIAVELDNGYFSGNPGPMRNVAMDQNPGATRGIHARKFHKTVIDWNALTQRDIGQMFEVTPLQGKAPEAGQWLELRVQLNDKPLQGARLSLGENGTPAVTDTRGLAKIQVAKGTNHIQAIFRDPVQGNARVTENSYEALFSFAAHE